MISCLCPTYNRYPGLGVLLEEAVECFLRQDHEDTELLILNDTPGLLLHFQHPRVRVFNVESRMPTLSAKLQFLIHEARGELLCRWDDDDLSLPWRLSLSVARLGNGLEWHPRNFWFANGTKPWELDRDSSNMHIMGLWHRDVLEQIDGYPEGHSGTEDQAFNRALAARGLMQAELLPREEVFYVYRWGTGSHHLSGVSDRERGAAPGALGRAGQAAGHDRPVRSPAPLAPRLRPIGSGRVRPEPG